MSCSSCLSRFKRPSSAAWIFFIGAFGLNMALGIWQIQRLEWKEALINRINVSEANAPVTTLPDDEAALKALEFHRVELKGYFTDTEFHVTPRYFHDKLGYHIFVPFRLTDGRTVIVNRGWVALDTKDSSVMPHEAAPKGKQDIKGIVRIGADRNHFTPESNPTKNIWFGRDIVRMGETAQLKKLIPISVDQLGEQEYKHQPVPSNGVIALMNDHLQYAITWFSIALGILIIFLVYHHKGKAEA